MPEDSDLEDMLAARREKLRRQEARRFNIVFGIGSAIFLIGAAVAIGNETGKFVTIPVGRFIMAFGGVICGAAGLTWKNIKV